MAPRKSDSTLVIRAPKTFNYVGNLKARQITDDPRSVAFRFDSVKLDLRHCLKIGAEAILWSAVFLTLAHKRGASCELLFPNDMKTSDALASSGVREILTYVGVRIKGDQPASGFSIPLPMCVMQSFSDVDRAADRIDLGSASIPSNLYSDVAETFVELANNGVEHSQSEIWTLGMVKFNIGKRKGNFEVVVADGGVGIRQTLNASAGLDKKRVSNDWSSVEYAIGELVSGTGDSHRGIGLFGVAEDARLPGVSSRIHSCEGLLHINERSEIRATKRIPFPGTLAYVSIQFPVV